MAPLARPYELDGFDRAILDALQHDNMTPMRAIGEAVNLSTAAVQRRIRRMNEAGIISANVAVADPDKLGLPITVVTSVEVEKERYEHVTGMMERYRAAPEVQQCYYVTGEITFILIIVVATMADYQTLTRRLFHDDPNVKRFQSYVSMERVKTGLSLAVRP